MTGFKEIAPGVSVPAGARRILYDGDPKEAEYLSAYREADAIRTELSGLRHRLIMLSLTVDRGQIPSDSDTLAVAGTIMAAIVLLHSLVDEKDDRNFRARAERSKALWDDVAENPGDYVVKEGKSR